MTQEDRTEPKYTVSDVVEMTGITKAKLIDYDNKGVLCPARVTKGVDQEWRMYSEEDLDRLEKIVVLLVYGFKIKEIKLILDDPTVDLTELVEAKIEQLQREESRLRNLLLFTKFVNITDTEFYEGLIRGPSDIDDFADIVRDSEEYVAAMEHIVALTDDDLLAMFDGLDAIVNDYVFVDPETGFAGIERVIDSFLTWWKKNISLSEDTGYLEFWAVFEDDSVIVSEVEEIGGEAAAANLQMSAFYSCMKGLMIDAQEDIQRVAALAEKDVVASLDSLQRIVALIYERMGVRPELEEDSSTLADLANSVLSYIERILKDQELKDYLDPNGRIMVSASDVMQTRKLLETTRAES